MAHGTPAPFLLDALAEGADTIVFAYDIASGQFAYLNAAFEKVWRKTRKSAMKDPASLVKMIHPEDRQEVQEMYQDLVFGVILKEVDFRIRFRDHSERWVRVKPQLLEEQQVIIGLADDISAQHQYTDYLKKYSGKKDAVLNILSHDLAGPLNIIKSLSHSLAENLPTELDQHLHQSIRLIEKSSQQGMRLIQEFLGQEFLESSGVEVIKQRVNLVESITQAMEEYQQSDQLLHKTFRFLHSSDPIYLNIDEVKFMQVVNNLISNSLKFTPDGGTITVAVEEKEASVVVMVADTGIGIPAKYHPILFDKFTQARRPGIKGEPSVGLGMSIIKTIIDWHHGKIWFESLENKGTTFYIEVPKSQ